MKTILYKNIHIYNNIVKNTIKNSETNKITIEGIKKKYDIINKKIKNIYESNQQYSNNEQCKCKCRSNIKNKKEIDMKNP